MKGTGVALITPFKKDLSIDFDGLSNIIENCISGGVNYLVALGTTGETATLNETEKNQIYRFIVEQVNKRVPCIAGIGGNDTRAICNQLNHFNYAGYDAILSVSPYYNKPNQEGIFLHYTEVAAHSNVPVILYNVPGRTGSNMSVATTLRLAENPNIVAIKEASGNPEQFMDIIQAKPANFYVISGDDNLTLPFVSMGMSGVISVIAQAYPKAFSNMVQMGVNGEIAEAKKIHYQLYAMMKAIFMDGNPGGIKALLEIQGICSQFVRLPLAPVKEDVYTFIQELEHQLKNN